MKKKFIILTITGLLLASLAACGGSKTPDASKNTADQEAQNQNQDSQGTSESFCQGGAWIFFILFTQILSLLLPE